jgi:hypothetical protein
MVIAVDTKPLWPTHTIQAAASVFAFVVMLATIVASACLLNEVTDKTDLGLAFNAKMKLTHTSLHDARDGNFELVKEYEVPS